MISYTETEKAAYSRKIRTREEILKEIGDFPRKGAVIMCHGTFDLVHPGHIRHLIYAKSKATKLIVSLTTDIHINKANYRPFVPEKLRALNLAALEMVDYVLIDLNPTPIENIRFIKPDFFAKGYEYSKGGIVNPKTQEEVDALQEYGGEMIYTPGDIVYSSSRLIDHEPPNLALEKLHALLDAEGLSFDSIGSALSKFKGIKVHIVGDMIVDSYCYCTLVGGNTKTPTFSLKQDSQIDFVGGAGIVAKHMQKAGADVTLTTILGDDPMKDFVLKDLVEAGVKVNAIISHSRPTTQKTLFSTQGYRMLKVDKLDNRAISGRDFDAFINYLKNTPCQAVVFSDFRHGIFSATTIDALTAAIPQGVYKVADSQVASRWGNILQFKNFDLITPNEREARFALADQDSTVRPLATELYNQSGCKLLILKLGEKGIITCQSGDSSVRSFFTIDSFVDRLVDAVGAGDALLSYATLAMVSSNSPIIASALGSVAAALACEQDGNIPVSPQDVLNKLNRIRKEWHFGE